DSRQDRIGYLDRGEFPAPVTRDQLGCRERPEFVVVLHNESPRRLERRASAAPRREILEARGRAEDGRVIAPAPGDLDADGQALAGETAGHGRRGLTGEIEGIGERRPFQVV